MEFIDFGSGGLVGLDALILFYQGPLMVVVFGTNDDGQSNYSKEVEQDIICDNCNPSSLL
ncbi:MAG: hypothetical protein IPP49_20165 [Saprospiraceae bacterium]|nr:hypothetical protein [Saprospiraceae bacterium]